MKRESHLQRLGAGVEAWNRWRAEHPGLRPDLRQARLAEARLAGIDLSKASLEGAILAGADLAGANLCGAALCGACSEDGGVSGYSLHRDSPEGFGGRNIAWTRLTDAHLEGARLVGADISGADLSGAFLDGAHLDGANLTWANLTGAKLRGASLDRAGLAGAHLTEADCSDARFAAAEFPGAKLEGTLLCRAELSGANLCCASLVGADLGGATLDGACIHGIAAWNLQGEPRSQKDLVITRSFAPVFEQKVTVDDLDVAQFVYLIMNNRKIRNVIDTVGRRGVLILGRFADSERKDVLEAIRERLRELGFVPIMFDFDRSALRDLTETAVLLAGLSRFVIADVTQPKSVPLELQAAMPTFAIPFVALIRRDEKPFAMIEDLARRPNWVSLVRYGTAEGLGRRLDEYVVRPALAKETDLLRIKAGPLATQDLPDD